MSAIRNEIREKADYEIRENERGRFMFKVFILSAVLIFFAGVSIFAVVKEKYDKHNEGVLLELSNELSESGSKSSYDQGIISDLKMPIYITGAVCFPGIYETILPIYLYELVDLAGGLTDAADGSSVNLAFQITENMMIVIPEKNASETGCKGGYTNDMDASSLQGFTRSEAENSNFPVNINTAGLSALCLLPGIGESTAMAIIEYREANGPYLRTEDIMKVPGIKQNRFEILKDKIKV